MNLQKIVANNIKGYRKKLALTQEALASKAGLHPNHLGRIERCETGVATSLPTLSKLSKALRIPPHHLLIPESYKEAE